MTIFNTLGPLYFPPFIPSKRQPSGRYSKKEVLNSSNTPEDYMYSSAFDYSSGKGFIGIDYI